MVNVNLGVMGHVDSGKTSLCRVLTEIPSTASLDKHPQSQERGITLDLGLSSFRLHHTDDPLDVTLVDCPGHASLVRTVLGASQIIDVVLLVVDSVKLVQTQTAECIVLAEVMCDKVVVVLNKIDLIGSTKEVEKIKGKLAKVFEKTKFGKNVPIVAISANPGDGKEAIGIADLHEALRRIICAPVRSPEGPLLFMFDHCFAIKGHGTVLTGTILAGSISVGEAIEIAGHGRKKVKSMQMFKKAVNRAIQGDRVGICVTGLDAAGIERGIATTDPTPVLEWIVCSCKSIPYFKGDIDTKAKFHVTIAHNTVMAQVYFIKPGNLSAPKIQPSFIGQKFDYCESMTDENGAADLVVMRLETPIIHPTGCLYLASKLDLDIHSPGCRLAFHGKVLQSLALEEVKGLVVTKKKNKTGLLERSEGNGRYICTGLMKKDSDPGKLVGLKVRHETTNSVGLIEGPFGKSGKMRIAFSSEIEGVSTDLKGNVLQEQRVVLDFEKRVKLA